jgi:hypothetical protein
MALPQFARNYGRSGAYENPQTVVDTKTRAIWGNAIQNIRNSIASTIEGVSKAASLEVQRTQKILDENARFVQENYSDFLKEIRKSGINNESFNNLALDIIRKKGEAYMGMRRGDEDATKNFSIYSSKLNELINLAETGAGAIESYTGDYVDNYSKVNTPGGVSTVGIDSVRSMNYQLAMPAKVGGTPNGKENWYLDDDLNIRTRYTSDQISKNFKEGNIKNDFIDANPLDIYTFDAGVVDDIRKETLKHFNQVGIIGKNNVLGDGFIQDEIVTIPSGSVEYDYQKIDLAKVTGSTRDFINAKAKTYLKRPSAANNLWNHQLQQGRNIIGPDGKPMYPDGFKLKLADGQIGTTFDTETSKVFTESLAQYMYDILPEGKQGSVRKITKDEPTAAETKAAKTAKEIADAAPQVYTDIFQNTESYFTNKKVNGKDILKVNVLPGSVPADGGKVAPVIELGYKSGSKVAGEEQTIFTTDMSFDLSDPARVRALINMLPENDAMKKELIKLIGDNPIESVSIETFEQRPILPGLSTN